MSREAAGEQQVLFSAQHLLFLIHFTQIPIFIYNKNTYFSIIDNSRLFKSQDTFSEFSGYSVCTTL